MARSSLDLLAASASNLDPQAPRVQREQWLSSVPVQKVMKTDVVTADPEMEIGDAARLLHQHRIICLPVVRGGHVVGIVTAFDLLSAIEQLDPRPS